MFVSREAIPYGLDNFTKGDRKTDILKAEVRETILYLLIDDRGVDKSFPFHPINLLLVQWLGYLKETRLEKTILYDDSLCVKTIPCLTYIINIKVFVLSFLYIVISC